MCIYADFRFEDIGSEMIEAWFSKYSDSMQGLDWEWGNSIWYFLEERYSDTYEVWPTKDDFVDYVDESIEEVTKTLNALKAIARESWPDFKAEALAKGFITAPTRKELEKKKRTDPRLREVYEEIDAG